MERLDQFFAWGIFAIGFGHCLYTFRNFKFGQPALWFFSAGLAMMLLAALNLLRIEYGQTAQLGLKMVAKAANLSMLAWAAAVVLAFRGSLKRNLQVPLAFVLFAGTTVISFARG